MSDRPVFKLDGRELDFEPGETIMDAAVRAGVYIPHLCFRAGYPPHGSCRVCVVEMDGRTVAACTTPAREGAEVLSETELNTGRRRTLLQMLFVEGNHVCPGCEKSGACQLQAVAYYTEMLTPRFKHFFPQRKLDASHPDFVLDLNRCILCELCVRASRDRDHKNVFAIDGRGEQARLVVNSASGKLGDSDFSHDDEAAHVCPVGAILHKHRGYERPIGERLYDRLPVSVVGDAADVDDGDPPV